MVPKARLLPEKKEQILKQNSIFKMMAFPSLCPPLAPKETNILNHKHILVELCTSSWSLSHMLKLYNDKDSLQRHTKFSYPTGWEFSDWIGETGLPSLPVVTLGKATV